MEKKELYDTFAIALENLQSNIHTITIAKVTKITGKTISCKPVINRIISGKSLEFPEFIEVPVVSLGGAQTYTVYPVKVGDYCLLFITERCFDNWWYGKDFEKPLDNRMHDYSDAFALVGILPNDKAIPIPTDDKILSKGNVKNEGNIETKGDLTVIGNCSLGKEGASKIPIVKEDLDKAIENITKAVIDYVMSAVPGQGGSPPSKVLKIESPSPITTKVKVE